MTTLSINGREVKTNWYKGRCSYPLSNGEDRNGWRIRVKTDFRESDEEFVERLGEFYSRVSLYESTTNVPGYHEVFAYVK